LRFKNRNIWFI